MTLVITSNFFSLRQLEFNACPKNESAFCLSRLLSMTATLRYTTYHTRRLSSEDISLIHSFTHRRLNSVYYYTAAVSIYVGISSCWCSVFGGSDIYFGKIQDISEFTAEGPYGARLTVAPNLKSCFT